MSIKSNGDSTNIPANIGDVDGPASSVNDDVVTFNGVTGKIIKDSGVAISNVPLLNAANVFTANQLISKTRPELQLLYSGTSKGRVFQWSANVVGISKNLSYDGSNWQRDDTTTPGVIIALQADGTIDSYFTPAGANPATLSQRFAVTGTDLRLFRGTGNPDPATLLSTADSAWTTFNSYYDGANWNLIDTSKPGYAYGMTGGYFLYATMTAGANPRTFNAQIFFDPTGNLIAFGGQITFPATQNPSSGANTLDDYVEGVWAPIDVSGAGLALVATTPARYIKIGQQVTVTVGVTYPVTASGAQAQVGGFPSLVGDANWAGAIGFSNLAANPTILAINGTFNMAMFAVGGAAFTNVQMSGSRVDFTITYRASA